jgi:hypothetical protein
MEEAGRSGVSVRAFCRQRGIRENIFYYWRRVLEADQGAACVCHEPEQCVVAEVKTSPRAGAVTVTDLIVGSGGRQLIPRGTDGATAPRPVPSALTPAP